MSRISLAILRMIEQFHEQQVMLLEDHQTLLVQQQELLRLLLRA